MLSEKKNLKQNLLIILGVLFILAGMGGVVFDKFQTLAVQSHGMYIGPMKQFAPAETGTPVESYFPSETPSVLPTATALPNLIDLHSPRSFFVHTGGSPDLETPSIPDRIVIPAINLDAPVVAADFNHLQVDGETFGQWQAPNMYAAGWHPNSALLGKRGNTVINGHHNEFGEVFGKLVDLKEGDFVYVYSRGQKFSFVIANRMILPERFQPVDVRLENARWINTTDDVRLTLITCWPKESNTHRLILVARPVAND